MVKCLEKEGVSILYGYPGVAITDTQEYAQAFAVAEVRKEA